MGFKNKIMSTNKLFSLVAYILAALFYILGTIQFFTEGYDSESFCWGTALTALALAYENSDKIKHLEKDRKI